MVAKPVNARCCSVLSLSYAKDIKALLACVFSLDMFNHEETMCFKQESSTALHCDLFCLVSSVFLYMSSVFSASGGVMSLRGMLCLIYIPFTNVFAKGNRKWVLFRGCCFADCFISSILSQLTQWTTANKKNVHKYGRIIYLSQVSG